MAAPLFGYVLTTQVSFLVVQNVANAASVRPGAAYDSFSTYSYAWQLFQLPYAIIGVSVITALLPRMSAHAAERRYPLVRDDFSTGVRLSSVIVVPAALLLLVLGAPLAEFLIAHGSTTVAEARYIGEVFAIFSLGLVPYMIFQLLLRVFYALHDSRTPMFVGVAVMAANIGISLLVLNVVPTGHVVEGLACLVRRVQRGGRGACPGASSAAAWAAWPAVRSRTAWGGCTWPPCRPCSSPGP